MPAAEISGMAARASLEQLVPTMAMIVGSAASLVPAAWPPSALHSVSSPDRLIGWPSSSPPASSMATSIAPRLSSPSPAVGPETVRAQARWIGSPGATSRQPMASVHSKATGSGGVVGAGPAAVGAAVVAGVPQAARIMAAMTSTEKRAKVRFISSPSSRDQNGLSEFVGCTYDGDKPWLPSIPPHLQRTLKVHSD